jgi:hypothetical protein
MMINNNNQIIYDYNILTQNSYIWLNIRKLIYWLNMRKLIYWLNMRKLIY